MLADRLDDSEDLLEVLVFGQIGLFFEDQALEVLAEEVVGFSGEKRLLEERVGELSFWVDVFADFFADQGIGLVV